MTQRITVSEGGAEYTLPVTLTETTGKDISGATVQIRLRAADGTGDWQDGVQTRPAPSSVTVSLLVDDTTPPGSYWLETKIDDDPEQLIRQWYRVEVA